MSQQKTHRRDVTNVKKKQDIFISILPSKLTQKVLRRRLKLACCPISTVYTLSLSLFLLETAGRDAEDRAENIQPMQLLKMIIPSTVVVWPTRSLASSEVGSWAATKRTAAGHPPSGRDIGGLSAPTWHGMAPGPPQPLPPLPLSTIPLRRSNHKVWRWWREMQTRVVLLSRNLCHLRWEDPHLPPSRHKHHISSA